MDSGSNSGLNDEGDSYSVYQEKLTSDGRLVKHIEDEQYTYDVQVESRTLEGSVATGIAEVDAQLEGKPIHGRQETNTKPVMNEQRFVYIVTYEEWDREVGDLGPTEIVGVYGTVGRANTAACRSSEGEFNKWTESWDDVGCITIRVDDEHWRCTVTRHTVQ